MPKLTKKEEDRLAWLTDQNHKQLGKQYRQAAYDMALCQVLMERSDLA